MFKGALSRALLHLLGVRQIDVDYVQIYPFFFSFGRKSSCSSDSLGYPTEILGA